MKGPEGYKNPVKALPWAALAVYSCLFEKAKSIELLAASVLVLRLRIWPQFLFAEGLTYENSQGPGGERNAWYVTVGCSGDRRRYTTVTTM
jgi:hypothetical protein